MHMEEPHQVSLINISIHKKGFLTPPDFNRCMKDIPKAELVYVGNCNSEFVESVKSATLPGMTFEGIICKATRERYSHPPIMFKIKNRAWIDKLKNTVPEELFETLL